jgi:hypothetical protein
MALVARSIVIPERFCGPPERGNGGVTAGLLAAFVPGDAEVTLRNPSPLETPLDVVHDGERRILRDGDTVVAEAVTADVDVDPPRAVSVADARRAAAASPVVVHPEWHPFPGCFVCGPDRAPGDGLRVHPGRVGAGEEFAAPVTYPPDLADADGLVPAHLIWAALDCPSSFVMYLDGRPETAFVLGRIAARIERRPSVDAALVALSWPLGRDGRKLFSASALFDGDEPVAVARATWIGISG